MPGSGDTAMKGISGSRTGVRGLGEAFLVLSVLLGLLVGWIGDADAKESFPKLANVYFGTLIGADLESLARWDVLVLPKRAQTWYQAELTTLRELNPDIIILVHMPVGYNGSWEAPEDNATLTNKLNSENWWLRDTVNGRVMINSRDALIDVTENCPIDSQGRKLNDWLPEYIADRFGPGGWWDGIFLDYCMDEMSWLNRYLSHPIDLNKNGIGESDAAVDAAWDQGMKHLVQKLRQLVGDEYIVTTNGNNTYYDVCDGSTRENFPNMHGDWYENITNPKYGYVAIESKYRTPAANVINTIWTGAYTSTGPVWTAEAKRKFLFTFASTLVYGDGYYSFDAASHSQVWWNDYYGIDLGLARGKGRVAQAVPGDRPDVQHGEMIRVRRFERGLAAVNPSDHAQKISLGGVYYPPDSWNGEFYPWSEARSTLDLAVSSGALLVGSGRNVATATGLTGRREAGANCIEWTAVGGAERYSVYRVDIDDGDESEPVLVAVVEGTLFDDESARASASRYYVAAIDEIGCEGQLSCPVEVSSGKGSDLSLALAAVGGHDGTLTLSWDAAEVEVGLSFDLRRTDRTGESAVVNKEPVEGWVVDRYVDEAVRPGHEYVYEAVAVVDGETVTLGSATGVGGDPAEPATELLGCYPHPVVDSTTFAFEVGGARDKPVGASLTIYDPAGRVVKRLLDEPMSPGSHTVEWDGTTDTGSRVASGCYFYSLAAGEDVRSGKVLVLR